MQWPILVRRQDSGRGLVNAAFRARDLPQRRRPAGTTPSPGANGKSAASLQFGASNGRSRHARIAAETRLLADEIVAGCRVAPLGPALGAPVFDEASSQYTVIGGYTIVNLAAGFRQAGPWEVFVWVKNLFDENYIQNLTVQAGNSGLIVGTPSDPRMMGVTLRARYWATLGARLGKPPCLFSSARSRYISQPTFPLGASALYRIGELNRVKSPLLRNAG